MDDARTIRKAAFTLDDGTPAIVRHRQVFDVVEGPDKGKRFIADAARVTVGTAAANEVCLTDPTVSRHHAAITAAHNDRYVLKDLQSTNGTFVGSMQVLEAFVGPGAEVRVGDTVLEFEPDARLTKVNPSATGRFGDMVGRSPLMLNVFGLLNELAPTALTCLFVGETGSGKELAARAVHQHSGRNGPLVVVDCASLHGNLIESELFGHQKGAFTGAERQRAGAFEAAAGGTVFLDEVGELPSNLQPRLLRVLERREVVRVGSNDPLDVDVRVVAATHRDLDAMVAEGSFRGDLYYRLAEAVIELPPLRSRMEDLPLLATAILQAHGSGHVLDSDALLLLQRQSFAGNVRELRNLLRRAAAFEKNPQVGAESIRRALSLGAPRAAAEVAGAIGEIHLELTLKEARQRWIADLTDQYLDGLFARFDGDIDAVAAHAGIHRKSVQRFLRERQASPYRR
ncbi:MAG: sigma 54-interacting transcriptional regulator [Myxococcota bacterium]